MKARYALFQVRGTLDASPVVLDKTRLLAANFQEGNSLADLCPIILSAWRRHGL